MSQNYLPYSWKVKQGIAVNRTSLLERLHPTRACLPLLDGSTWRCRPSDDEEEVVALYVPEDDEVGVPPTVPEDDEVGSVVDLN
jgi:hypothetical protein